MACGRPIAYACTGSLPEVVGDAGVQVHPLDVNALTDALLTLLERRDERLRLGQAAQEQASTFKWGRAAIEITQVYASN